MKRLQRKPTEFGKEKVKTKERMTKEKERAGIRKGSWKNNAKVKRQ